MNRFPIPVLSLPSSTLAFADVRRSAEQGSTAAAANGLSAPYAWGPDNSHTSFAREAAAAEARERLLFFDALAGAAF